MAAYGCSRQPKLRNECLNVSSSTLSIWLAHSLEN
ncbi:MAG: hypothetical protein ACE5OZ_19770 [Candidatus Heimdallarchaeota archaeon]